MVGRGPFAYFWVLPKVSRCKSGTLGGRDRSNGYVLSQTQRHGRPEGRHGTQLPPTVQPATLSAAPTPVLKPLHPEKPPKSAQTLALPKPGAHRKVC
ncbi:hypothetical protein EMIT0357P_160051 [Pseudomonas marginalis]